MGRLAEELRAAAELRREPATVTWLSERPELRQTAASELVKRA